MPAVTAAAARLGFGELWRRTHAQRSGGTRLTDGLTDRHAAEAKTRGGRERENGTGRGVVWLQTAEFKDASRNRIDA